MHAKVSAQVGLRLYSQTVIKLAREKRGRDGALREHSPDGRKGNSNREWQAQARLGARLKRDAM